MLYLVSTPIGNLKDISFRAIDILKSCDLILCEDTRHSSILFNEYNIKKPLKSLHKFSEAKRESEIISLLKEGKTIALVSDAGTPAISDPGERLVKKCIEEALPVTAIPGPAALIHALVCSGLSSARFQFTGFLPQKKGELQEALLDLVFFEGTSICYESPKRIEKVLKSLAALAPEIKVVIARELTKKFEEFLRGSAESVLEAVQTRPLKGEIVLLVEGSSDRLWDKLTLEQHVLWLQDSFKIPQKEAIKLAARLRHIPKREIYRLFH
jgi:16S rRNA (cytidine1402-2'-O)-methyltransferase